MKKLVANIKELFKTNEKQIFFSSSIKMQNKDDELNLNNKINSSQGKLQIDVPFENQCCICFGFTNKKKALIPCGHMQYCDECITKINKCSLCNRNFSGILTVFY